MPLRRALVVFLPLLVLTAGLSGVDIFDGILKLSEAARIGAGIGVFAVAAALGWMLTGDLRPAGRN